jgi:LysM repeat protein
VECFRCDREATAECPRCGALYCDDHGDALCERCQDPALALPSYRIYRGSLLALLGGTVFAVWLLVRPPATIDGDSPVPPALAGVIPTATATITPTPASASTTTPAAATTETSTPTPSPTPDPTAAPANPDFREHTVSEGDTLFSIALQYVPRDKDVLDFVEEIAAYNELTDANAITLGTVLKIPTE